MIRYLETLLPLKQAELTAFCSGSVFGLKALGPVLSYGTGYRFVSAWEQRGEDGALTAFLSKYYGTVTVCAASGCDAEELLAFLTMVGYDALVGPYDLLEPLGETGSKGCVMSLPDGSALQAAPVSTGDGCELVFNDRFRSFYEVLTESNPGYLTADYSAFLTDLSHRVRHGTAGTVLLTEDGMPAATAAALVLTPDALFLGAVSTIPGCRGRHYASTCLHALCQKYPGRRVFLMCLPEKQSFYETLGMTPTDSYLEVSSSYK